MTNDIYKHQQQYLQQYYQQQQSNSFLNKQVNSQIPTKCTLQQQKQQHIIKIPSTTIKDKILFK